MDHEAIIANHYDTIAKEYDGVNQAGDRLLSRLKHVPTETAILDVGCGTGNLTFRLPELGAFTRVVGVDISQGVLDIARRHAQKAQFDNVEFVRASACSLPFENDEFDVVISNIVFHLVPDRPGCLREILRVLRPSGYALLQFMGGGPSGAEIVEIIRTVCEEEAPGFSSARLLCMVLVEDVVTADMMEAWLTDLGVERFEISWCRKVVRVSEAEMPKMLTFLDLVGGFWRQGLENLVAERIWKRVTEKIGETIGSAGCFRHTVNHLLVEFAKPAIMRRISPLRQESRALDLPSDQYAPGEVGGTG